MAAPGAYPFQEEADALEDTYRRLLFYYAEGSTDPMQTKIYNELTASAYELADRIMQNALIRESPELYYAARRTFDAHPENMAELIEVILSSYEIDDRVFAEKSTALLFKRIWTSGYLAEEEAASLRAAIGGENAPLPGNAAGAGHMTIVNCQIVSALILGLQAQFDKRKFLLLGIAAGSDDREVKIRAYTGILITLYLYRRRIDCLPEIGHCLDALAERPEFRKIIHMIILRFILSRETEKISNRIRDELIPEMMKLHPHTPPGDVSPENFEEGMNPEWMEKLSGGKLGKKLEELNRLQEEGADIMHSTFIHLKNFPFFNETGNWFLPFSRSVVTAPEKDAVMKSLELMTGAGFMCNSDLYSFYFSLRQMPDAGRRLMTGRLEEQLNEINRQRKAEIQTGDDAFERIVGQYVQDLYRFYKLYPRRGEFNDIFEQRLDFHNLPVLQACFADRNDLTDIADNYLRKNYFDDALTVYGRLSESSGGDDETLYQKTGYCRQMSGDYGGAIADYAKAEIINPASKWLLRRAAQCYRAARQPAKAVDYYLRYEKLDPENLSVLLSIGSCYLDMKNYPEALKYYFKADYLDAGSNKAWRPIAWCSFLTGKYDQARNYYGKILSCRPDSPDYMNAGHTEWVLQNIRGALALYRKSAAATEGGHEKFRAAFTRDIPELAAAGIDPAEIPLILDQLSYSPE
jgi:tetratricopeptide (TPR) repeat protein